MCYFIALFILLLKELRKSGAMKSQLELYKRQVQELQIKSSEEIRRADKAEFEGKRIQEKMVAVQREKERLIAERDSLKETNEELRCTQVQKGKQRVHCILIRP